uniref:Uncharacterized protein n=1 Tax=Romanomermis culicivorax TaxID=13658 RepID=A0A915LAN3_ROMCU
MIKKISPQNFLHEAFTQPAFGCLIVALDSLNPWNNLTFSESSSSSFSKNQRKVTGVLAATLTVKITVSDGRRMQLGIALISLGGRASTWGNKIVVLRFSTASILRLCVDTPTIPLSRTSLYPDHPVTPTIPLPRLMLKSLDILIKRRIVYTVSIAATRTAKSTPLENSLRVHKPHYTAMRLRVAACKIFFRLRVTRGPQFLKAAKKCAVRTVFRPLRPTMPTALRPCPTCHTVTATVDEHLPYGLTAVTVYSPANGLAVQLRMDSRSVETILKRLSVFPSIRNPLNFQ